MTLLAPAWCVPGAASRGDRVRRRYDWTHEARRLHHARLRARARGRSFRRRATGRPGQEADHPRSDLADEARGLARSLAGRRWVVFSVTEPSYDEKKESADLWIVPADGGATPRRLTSAKGTESAPAWSPDSRRLAFAAKREDDEVTQIYVIDVAGGGEARRVTSAPLAARAPVWSPDGGSILYQSAAYPGAADDEANKKIAAERKDAKSKVRIYDTFPIRRWDKWLDDTQTHLFVASAEGEGETRDLLAGTTLVGRPGFGAPTGEGSTEDLEPGLVPRRDVHRLRGHHRPRRRRALARGLPPLRGPRRRRRAAAAHHRPVDLRRPAVRARRPLALLPRQRRVGKDLRPRPPGLRALAVDAAPPPPSPPTFDRSVADFAFAPDGKTLYLTAEDSGYVQALLGPRGGRGR